MKKLLVLYLLLNLPIVSAGHAFKENYYQKDWCDKYHGIMEYRLNDDTRVDCLTKNYAVEFDFAYKWAESIGQSLYYAQETGKKPAIVLIIEKDTDFKYYERAEKLANNYDIQLWYMEKPDKKNYQNKNKSTENQIYNLISQFLRYIVNEILGLIMSIFL